MGDISGDVCIDEEDQFYRERYNEPEYFDQPVPEPMPEPYEIPQTTTSMSNFNADSNGSSRNGVHSIASVSGKNGVIDSSTLPWKTHTFHVATSLKLADINRPEYIIDLREQHEKNPEFQKLLKQNGTIGNMYIQNFHNGLPVSLAVAVDMPVPSGARFKLETDNRSTIKNRVAGSHLVPASNTPANFVVQRNSTTFTDRPYMLLKRPAELERSIISFYPGKTIENLTQGVKKHPDDPNLRTLARNHMIVDQFYGVKNIPVPDNEMHVLDASDVRRIGDLMVTDFHKYAKQSELPNLRVKLFRSHAAKNTPGDVEYNWTDNTELNNGLDVSSLAGQKMLNSYKTTPQTVSFDIVIETAPIA